MTFFDILYYSKSSPIKILVDRINLFSKNLHSNKLCHTALQNQIEVPLLYLSNNKKVNSTYFVFWQFVSFNADLALVTDSKSVKFHFVKLHGIFCSADHHIALSAFDHVARTLKCVYLIIGHWYIFFTAIEKVNILVSNFITLLTPI